MKFENKIRFMCAKCGSDLKIGIIQGVLKKLSVKFKNRDLTKGFK